MFVRANSALSASSSTAVRYAPGRGSARSRVEAAVLLTTCSLQYVVGMTSSLLVCPQTKLELVLASPSSGSPNSLRPVPRIGSGSRYDDRPTTILVRADGGAAFPVHAGVPILLAPEMLVPEHVNQVIDVTAPRYAEAYMERDFYDRVSRADAKSIEQSPAYRELERIRARGAGASFPNPVGLWLDAAYETVAQVEAYSFIAPLFDKRVLQLGGKGVHAVKFLLAGAEEVWLASPMLGEIEFAASLAERAGVGDRLRTVIAVAEELPFRDGVFDAVYAGGTLHHMVTGVALPEIARVLRRGGRFAAVEPWRAALYGIGMKLVGKREPETEVGCRPMTPVRLEALGETFRHAEVRHHGALTRYPLLALERVGLRPPLLLLWSIMKADDAVAHRIGFLRRQGSCVAVLAAT